MFVSLLNSKPTLMPTTKLNIDFHVLPTGDPKTIHIADSSEWLDIKDKPSIIEITLPSSKAVKTNYFKKGEVNIFNSINTGFNHPELGDSTYLDLPDGLYKITVKGSPDNFYKTKYLAKTDKLDLELNEILIKLSCEGGVDRELLSILEQLEFVLKVARSHARLGNNCKSADFLSKAQELMDDFKHCSCRL